MNHLLAIRGIDINIPDHDAAMSAHYVPIAAAQSMGALTGDVMKTALPAINASAPQFRYKSTESKNAVTVDNASSRSSNMIEKLLAPFNRKAGTFNFNNAALGSSLDAALEVVNTMAESQNATVIASSDATMAAKDLLATGFSGLKPTWEALWDKYNTLITRSLAQDVVYPGINDLPIISDGTTKCQINGKIVANADMRTMITTSTRVNRLASSFAMAEYILTQGLSHSITASLNHISNINYDNNLNNSYGADEHDVGAMVSPYLNFYAGLAISACLLELFDRLKAANLFNETVIYMAGEFGRNPRNDGTGSDHGHKGGHCSIFSGAYTNGPIVLGNIYTNKTQSKLDTGTWGYGAPVAALGVPVNMGHVCSTIAGLLRVPSPVSAPTLAIIDSTQKLVPTIELAKQVD